MYNSCVAVVDAWGSIGPMWNQLLTNAPAPVSVFSHCQASYFILFWFFIRFFHEAIPSHSCSGFRMFPRYGNPTICLVRIPTIKVRNLEITPVMHFSGTGRSWTFTAAIGLLPDHTNCSTHALL
jgi:hypothetical protein